MPFYRPDQIVVGDRFRTVSANDPSFAELVDSIRECGQLQPILVTRNLELVDGLRRLLACRHLGREVWAETEETARLTLSTPLQRRRAELQANLKRRDFTPAELARGIAELDRLMREAYGSKRPGQRNDGWTLVETAKMLGYRSHQPVSDALAVAQALEQNTIPALNQAKTMKEAVNMIRHARRLEAARQVARPCLDGQDLYEYFSRRVILGDCLQGLRELDSHICDLFVTDPPFGIDLDVVVRDRPESLGKVQTVYEDKPEEVMGLLQQLIPELARIGKPSCHVIMFCAVASWHHLAGLFADAGFRVHKKPLVWIKARKEPFTLWLGRTAYPYLYPSSSYEVALFAWRGEARLARPGRPDVLVHPRVAGAVHQAQKPVPLMEELISYVYHPGTNPLLIDPFAGSCSTLIAARRLGIQQYFGYEINPEFRERGIAEMIRDYLQSRKEAGDG